MTDKPYPFTPEQEAWLQDLETTEEPQTTEWLHVIEEKGSGDFVNPVGYCCLGRACVVLGIRESDPGEYTPEVTLFGDQREDAMLPREAVLMLGLRSSTGELLHPVPSNDEEYPIRDLTMMNDAGWSFKQIAAYIRANPENVFLPPEKDKA